MKRNIGITWAIMLWHGEAYGYIAIVFSILRGHGSRAFFRALKANWTFIGNLIHLSDKAFFHRGCNVEKIKIY